MEINGLNGRVCFFDSGIGGISLLIRCSELLPSTDFYYFADNSNVPYGSKSEEEIFSLADDMFGRMQRLKPDAAVIACNTVTAVAADRLRLKYSFPIIGIQPAVKPAAASGGRCVILSTPATAHSLSVAKLIDKFGGKNTEAAACPRLAAYIEKNIFALQEDDVKSLLPNLKADNVILGCTHYVFIRGIIEKYYGCPVFDGTEGTANRLCAVLGNSVHRGPKRGKIFFFGGDSGLNCAVFRRFKSIL